MVKGIKTLSSHQSIPSCASASPSAVCFSSSTSSSWPIAVVAANRHPNLHRLIVARLGLDLHLLLRQGLLRPRRRRRGSPDFEVANYEECLCLHIRRRLRAEGQRELLRRQARFCGLVQRF
ncbi:hypothetical protein PHJA_001791900 [Phtheirospermum japonicum]|uniref:Uncharacterized protein n=1 Tax=Phtheirospermum japonicum TaxID=374723 RepID=A0A830CHA0_9LAMI|nr:hypothetical protein PHJA_001791900 [Phtheirospermum japonicum]